MVRLKVGERSGQFLITKVNPTSYNIICDCGTGMANVLTGYIDYKSFTQCGHGDINDTRFYKLRHIYERGALKRGYVFELTQAQCNVLFTSNCYYCNEQPSCRLRQYKHYQYLYNGIDRVDNALGYVLGNVVSCCHTCNVAKKDYSENHFLSWIRRVYEHNFTPRQEVLAAC